MNLKIDDNMDTKPKMFTVISLNKSKTKLRFVQLTLCQFGKLFSKDVINFLSQRNNLLLPVNGKIGKISIIKMTIDSKECLVVNLFSSSFTNRFGSGNFKVFTKCVEPMGSPNGNVSVIDPQPKPVVKKLSSLNVSEMKTPSEKTDTGCPNKINPTKTKIIPFPTYMVFSHDYSMIIRFNRFQNPPNQFYLSDVG